MQHRNINGLIRILEQYKKAELTERQKEYIYIMSALFEKPLSDLSGITILGWEDEGIPLWTIAKAYSIMMNRCEKQSLRYMEIVLKNWGDDLNKPTEPRTWEDVVRSRTQNSVF